MGIFSKRKSESSSEAATAGQDKQTAIKLRFEREDIVIGYAMGCKGTDKRPICSFDITANATISFSSPLDWLQGKHITFTVYSGEEFIRRREDNWGIGTLSVVETRQTNSYLDLCLDVASARDFAYMLNDWRRTEKTILYLAMDLWLEKEFTHAMRGYPIKKFVIHRVSCCVHPPNARGADE